MMGEDRRKVTTAGQAEAAAKSPRKSPRLALAVVPLAAVPPESSESPSTPLDSSESTCSDDSQQHQHMFMTDEELGAIANNFKTAKEHPMCQHDECKVTWKGASDGGGEDAGMMLCTECGCHFCTGPVGDRLNPGAHAYWQAHEAMHRVALWYDDPYQAYCFDCEEGLTLGGTGNSSQNKDAWAVVARNGKDQSGSDDVGGHASGVAYGYGDGYVIRGIPDLGSSCYMNALLQCLLALGKLRRMILGLDAWLGFTGHYMKELFVETSSANDATRLLNPRMLLDCVGGSGQQFKGNEMEDTYEFLVSLRNALVKEVKELNELNCVQGGAVFPAVGESIFRVQMCQTISCKSCPNNSVKHIELYDLQAPVPLPSKDPLARSVVSSPKIESRMSPRNICKKLFQETHKSGGEKLQTIAEGCELGDGVMEKKPEPLQVDSTKVKDVVHDRLQTHENDGPRGIVEVSIKALDFIPNLFDGIEGVEIADSHNPEDIVPPLVSTEDKGKAQGSDIIPPLAITKDMGKAQSSDIIPPFVITEEKGKAQSSDIIHDVAEHMNSLSSIEDCLALLLIEQPVEWTCGNCSNVAELRRNNSSKNGEQMMGSTNVNTTVGGDQTEQADRKTCPSEQSVDLNRFSSECTSPSRQPHVFDAQDKVILSEDRTTKGITSETSCDEKDSPSSSTGKKKTESHQGVQEAVPICLPTDKQTNMLSVQDNQDTSTENQGRGKQVKLDDHSVKQVDKDQNEQKNEDGGATQTILLTKLPPALTIQLKRFAADLSKLVGHVSFKEILHVGPFVDPSCEDKDNSSMECACHFCTGPVGGKLNPRAHVYWHTHEAMHRVALWYDDPYEACCFNCEEGLTLGGNSSQNKDAWAVVARNGKDQWGSDDVGGHASGVAYGYGDGYVTRGMPNLGRSCYMNALLQCLLALGKLRRMILGLDAWLGFTGHYLKELFVETSSANDATRLLDPLMLLDCVGGSDQQFKGNEMQDIYQFLVSLRSALDKEVKELNNQWGTDDVSGHASGIVHVGGFDMRGMQNERSGNEIEPEEFRSLGKEDPIFVKNLQGTTSCLAIQLDKTAECLMDKIRNKTIFNPVEHYIEYSGRVLDPLQQLSTYGILKNSTVHICSRLRGGILLSDHPVQGVLVVVRTMPGNQNKERVELTSYGCHILHSIVKLVADTIDQGSCWSAALTFSDFVVEDGKIRVLRLPDAEATPIQIMDNFEDLGVEINELFQLDGALPDYLDHFVRLIQNCQLCAGQLERKYKLCILTHFACLPLMSQVNVILQLRIFFDGLKSNSERQAFEDVVRNCAIKQNWFNFARNNFIMSFTFAKSSYRRSNWSAFNLARNFGTHSHKNSCVFDFYSGVLLRQEYDPDGVEVLMFECFGEFIADLIIDLIDAGFDIFELLTCCSCNYQ